MMRVLCLLLGLLAAVAPVWANVAQFYSASVPVESQSTRDRDRAASQGLREVLVRASGTLDIDQSPEALNALGRAASLMQQFQYERVRGPDGRMQQHLVMSFAPAEVERILTRGALPFWPINRPATLVWLVEDDAAEGRRLTSDRTTPVTQGLLAAAQRRGLPLIFPLLDLDDQLALSAEQAWSLDDKAIAEASLRYRADSVLVGRFTQTSTGQWWSTWQFFHRGDQRIYDLRGDDGLALGQQALAPLVDYLASLYAVVPNAEAVPQLVVQVNRVTTFAAYRALLDYWRALAVVTAANLISVADDSLLFTVQLNGSLDQLHNALALDNKLSPEAQAPSGAPWIALPRGTVDHPLRYEWVARSR